MKDIEYYVDRSDPTRFYYIPGTPKSQETPQGHPAASMIVLDQVAMLQLSSEWSVRSEELEELESAITEQFELETVSLQPAPLSIESVTLSLRTNKGDYEVLSESESSGYPPYTAVFSVQLEGDQKAQAIAAFNGRKEQLIITYKAVLRASVIERTTDVSTWFGCGNGMDYVQVLAI
ncbi:hypothetical protein ACQ4M3_15055 [Leptolyngbya sp. AN03gr2]|uniref:hypothetical protein n=1 Tax=unclassified Leptolyngbya TaxID=2650499 RepID=UPI003D311D5A